MVWRDGDGSIVGFNIVASLGSRGVDGAAGGEQRLAGSRRRTRDARSRASAGCRSRGARTIGLETMPRTVDNIGFYSRLGFEPGFMTVTMIRELTGPAGARRRRS